MAPQLGPATSAAGIDRWITGQHRHRFFSRLDLAEDTKPCFGPASNNKLKRQSEGKGHVKTHIN